MFSTPALLLALAVSPALVAQQAAPAPTTVDANALGRQYTAQFFAGETDLLWDRFTLEMKRALKSKEAFKAFQAQAVTQLGTETSVIDEVVSPMWNVQVYMRSVKTERWPGPVDFTWSFDDKGMVAGFTLAPKRQVAETRFLSYQTKTALRLPFEGAWTVFWGGRTLDENYHAMTRDQRFALDLVVVKDGATHVGDGKQNKQYFAYGQTLLAPGAGQVITLVDGVPDNVPGVMNPAKAAGNHVVIDHGNGEYSLLAHFRPGTFKVKVGQKVKAGTPIGQCGNSGNSSEAHLHYHLQNAAAFGQGEGLPAQFRQFKAGGKPVAIGEPTKGQVIAP